MSREARLHQTFNTKREESRTQIIRPVFLQSIYPSTQIALNMSAQAELQALLRFLSTDAKVPLAVAMSKVKDLRTAQLARYGGSLPSSSCSISSSFEESQDSVR